MRTPSKRKAISPILATVILIAITLIAAVAIATFVFGIFGSSASPATYSIVSSSVTCVGANTAAPTTGIWAGTSNMGATAGHGWCAMTVQNSGSASGTIVSSGASNDFTLVSAAAASPYTYTVPAGSSVTVYLKTTYAAGTALSSGQTVTGYLVPGGSAANLNFYLVAP